MIKGHLETLGENRGFGIFDGKLVELFETIQNPCFLNLDCATALELIDVINNDDKVFEHISRRDY